MRAHLVLLDFSEYKSIRADGETTLSKKIEMILVIEMRETKAITNYRIVVKR